MTERDLAVDIVSGFSIDKILNTVDFIEAIVGRSGLRHGDRLAMQFCKEHRLPRMTAMELVACLGIAANRKMLLVDPSEGNQDKPTIIH